LSAYKLRLIAYKVALHEENSTHKQELIQERQFIEYNAQPRRQKCSPKDVGKVALFFPCEAKYFFLTLAKNFTCILVPNFQSCLFNSEINFIRQIT